MSLYQNLIDAMSHTNIKLICQIPVSDLEYNEILKEARFKIMHLTMQCIPKPDPILAVALVQIAIRRYEDGNYWDFFLDEIDLDISVSKRNYIGQIFAATLHKYGLFEIPREKGSNYAYVENIKAHAFVPDKYSNGYWDFLFSFYDRNLFRQIPDNIDEELFELIDFMSESLSGNNDNIKLESIDNKPAKTYKLNKATRNVISQCSPNIISGMLYDHLELLDKYYYDNEVPKGNKRFESLFLQWIYKKESEINIAIKTGKKRRQSSVYYRKPHFELNRKDGQLYFIIPAQKIRNDDFTGKAELIIDSGNQIHNYPLSMYRAYGTLVSEPLKLAWDDPFTEIKLTVKSKVSHEIVIKSRNFIIFDADFCEINILKKGQNYLLVKKGVQVKYKNPPVYINSDGFWWDELSFSNIDEDSVIYIADRPVSMSGDFVDSPCFDYVSKEYRLLKNNREIQTAYKHPIVSFKIPKETIKGSFLWCNTIKYEINAFAQQILSLPDDNAFYGVTFDLKDILPEVDGEYIIKLDIPGKPKRNICEYVLIKDLRFIPEKNRFIYATTASIYTSGNYQLEPVNCSKISSEEILFDLSQNEQQEVHLRLTLNEIEYLVLIKLSVFKYGFEKQWRFDRMDMLWYTELKNDLYISMSGAASARIYLGKNSYKYIPGIKISEGEFRFDLSTLIADFIAGRKTFDYFNLQFYDNKWRNLTLFRVCKHIWINSFQFKYDLETETICIDTDYEGKAVLKVKISDYSTGNILVEKNLACGRTCFPELEFSGLYTIEKFEVEEDPMGLADKITPIGSPSYKVGAINFSDVSNCKMLIKGIVHKGEKLDLNYCYKIFNIHKVDTNIYEGSLYEKHKPNGGIKYKPSMISNLVRIEVAEENGNLHVLSLLCGSDEDFDILYCDLTLKKLLTWDDEVLSNSKNYKRFLPLYEDETEYNVEFRRVE